ncbi:MAG: single-stranded-DNA-specific exonuclease RecJ [Tepidisphaera sp.]|nr:single-stranded-DNA-specific exonuclease RecJ [Tepidisphaera sp.]
MPVATDRTQPVPDLINTSAAAAPGAGGQARGRASDAAGVRGMTKVWRLRGAMSAAGAPLVQRVLIARGLTDPATSEKFLDPKLTHLHDPSGIPDLDKAAERLLRAARAGERIVIYGDYDVDGVSATAILFHMLREIVPGVKLGTYVPHRIDEGYGLNVEAVRELAREGARVIVSVDCGITAIAPAQAAREAGVDLIITDHHNPPASVAELPDAFAVVHPRRPDSAYPFGELCGAGVAFKLAWRLATLASGGSKVSEAMRGLLIELLGLTSLGVIADVVPLVDENRVIAKFGLGRIKDSRIEGLRALVRASRLDSDKVSAEDVGFKIGPRLNACGRMGHAREAVELLTVASGARANEIATQLSRMNDERRDEERRIFEHALEMAQSQGMTGTQSRAIVLAHEGWHSGVVGIVCSRLVERFNRPTILLSSAAEGLHGSGRSIEGFSLHAALVECAPLLTTFGGHDMAAGMKLAHAQFAAFVQGFTQVANREISPEQLVGAAKYDCGASLHELDLTTVRQLARLGPFGAGNPGVRVRLAPVRVAARPEIFGQTGKHLSLRVADERGGRGLRLIGWNWASRIAEIPAGATIEAIVTPTISTFGSPSVEPVIDDIRIVDAPSGPGA